MAENSVSQGTSTVKEVNPIHLEFIDETRPAVLSTEVGERFQKKHRHILRDIEQIRSQVPKIFFETNFGLNEYEVPCGFGTRKEKCYLLTRDAFSLLVMGFTGSAALRWKLKYIEAFNALESAVRDNIRTDALEYGRAQGITAARALPAAEAACKAAYLDGMKEGQRVQKRNDGLATLERALGYQAKGVNMTDTAKLVGVPASTLRGRMQRLRRFLSSPVQTDEQNKGTVTA